MVVVPLIQRNLRLLGKVDAVARPFASSDASPFQNPFKSIDLSLGKTNQAASSTIGPSASNRSNNLDTAQARTSAPRGFAENALSEIAKLSNRINTINKRLSEETLSEDQKQASASELAALSNHYGEIIHSKEFNQLIEVSSAIESNLTAANSVDALFATTQSSRGLLGENYLDLVSGANLAGIQQFNSGLKELLNTSPEQLSQGDNAQKISEIAKKELSILQNSSSFASAATASATQATSTNVSVPQIQELQFAYNDKIALSLRGYSGTDLLAAAVTHLEDDPKHVSELILEIPKPKSKEIEAETTNKKSLFEDTKAIGTIET